MLQVIKDMFHSEKGVFAYLLLLIVESVFLILGKISYAEWQEFSLYLAGIYVGGKTIQGAAATVASGKSTDAATVREGFDMFRDMLAKNDSEVDAALDEKFKKPAESGGGDAEGGK